MRIGLLTNQTTQECALSDRLVRSRCAFTIAEILVVLAVLGGVVALLFPLLGRMQEAGRVTHSISNHFTGSSSHYYPQRLQRSDLLGAPAVRFCVDSGQLFSFFDGLVEMLQRDMVLEKANAPNGPFWSGLN